MLTINHSKYCLYLHNFFLFLQSHSLNKIFSLSWMKFSGRKLKFMDVVYLESIVLRSSTLRIAIYHANIPYWVYFEDVNYGIFVGSWEFFKTYKRCAAKLAHSLNCNIFSALLDQDLFISSNQTKNFLVKSKYFNYQPFR